MVPLPTQEERVEILKVHFRDKKISPDVDVDVIARGTPGMSGADLANLVNEAALFAVRRGAQEVHKEDFDAARDRVLMGLRRESLALSEEEKEIVAYHEGGHAVCAYVLEFADPLHKVTILPTGMALGVTQQLPLEERHIYKREYIVDSLVVRLGGRVAEQLVFGHQSTGAENDLVGCTELARKMVREWGMSDRVGPMAWGSQGAVFLGEDLMHSRDYSDETARVIDEEVEHILRDEEERCRKVLEEYRAGLDAVAKALLERETLGGEEVADARRQRDGPQGRRAAHDPPRRRHRRARHRDHRRPPDQPRPDAVTEPVRVDVLANARVDSVGGCAELGEGGPEVGGGVRADERGARHAVAVDEHGDRCRVDLVARVQARVRRVYSTSTTPTSSDSSGSALSTRPAHESQCRDVNSTTSHGASGRGKSLRSSCCGHDRAPLRRRCRGTSMLEPPRDRDRDGDDRNSDDDAGEPRRRRYRFAFSALGYPARGWRRRRRRSSTRRRSGRST